MNGWINAFASLWLLTGNVCIYIKINHTTSAPLHNTYFFFMVVKYIANYSKILFVASNSICQQKFHNFSQFLANFTRPTDSDNIQNVRFYQNLSAFPTILLNFVAVFVFPFLSLPRERDWEREQLFHYSLLNFANKNILIIIKRWLLRQSCISLQSCIRLAVNSFLTWIKFGFLIFLNF